MAKITTCMLVPLIFVVSVIGLFFASTDPSTWPQKTTQLAASDTKLMSPASTVWCESVFLSSTEHDFVAYRLSETPTVSPLNLRRQVADLQTRLDRKRLNRLERTFFLLPGSVIRIYACATGKQAHLHVYKGSASRECLDITKQSSESEEDESDERQGTWNLSYDGDSEEDALRSLREKCPEVIKSQDVPVIQEAYEGKDCVESVTHAVTINVTTMGNYVVIMTNDGFGSSDVQLRLVLDRATYDLQGLEKSVHTCSTFTPCIVPLRFASRERILLRIPTEPDSGKNSFLVHSQCRPRIAMFAFLIVLLPVVLFVVVAFVVRSGSRRTSVYQSANQMESGTSDHRWRTFASPFLSEQVSRNAHASRTQPLIGSAAEDIAADNPQCMDDDSDPPPYDFIYGSPPPSYSSLNAALKEGK